MPERRYNDDEAAAIFLAAVEGPKTPPITGPHTEGLTLVELQDIGREVGISADALAQAAKSLELQGRGASRSFLGLPIAVERTVELNRWLTDDEWERLVVELREVFNARGTVSSYGSLRQWTNGNLQALLEPTPTGHRLRLGTLNGGARSSMLTGLAAVGIAAGVTAAVAMGSGDVVGAAPGIGFLLITGLGIFANGALRLPRWARLRERQIEGVSTRLALSAGPPPTTTLPRPQQD